MFNVVKKLLLARQLGFEKGKISLMGQPLVLLPAEAIVYITKNLPPSSDLVGLLYRGSKEAMIKGFGLKIGQKFGLKKGELQHWLSDIAQLGGWGIIDFKELDWNSCSSIIHASKSTIAELYGQSNKPVDHVWRGLFAGGASVCFKKDVDCIETKCKAMGYSRCEFIIRHIEELKKIKNVDIKWQLGINE